MQNYIDIIDGQAFSFFQSLTLSHLKLLSEQIMTWLTDIYMHLPIYIYIYIYIYSADDEITLGPQFTKIVFYT